jgi:VanZ like family
MTAAATPPRLSRRRAATLLALYLLAPAVLVLGPLPVQLLDDTVTAARDVFGSLGGDPASLSRMEVEAASNVVMFVPIGFLLRFCVLGVPAPWLFAACVGASAAIELLQGLFLSQRHASVRDVAMNATGALLGLLAARMWARA